MTPLREKEKDSELSFKESRDIDASKTIAVDEPTKIQLLLLEQVKELKQYINNQAILYSDSERRTMQEIIRLHEIIKRLKMENERLLERQEKLKGLNGIENCIFPSDNIEASFEMSVEDFSSFHSSWDGTKSSEGEIALEKKHQVEVERIQQQADEMGKFFNQINFREFEFREVKNSRNLLELFSRLSKSKNFSWI